MTLHRLRRWALIAILMAGAAVHLLPAAALVLPGRLETLYGVRDLAADEVLLLRHRALLLGLLGAGLLAAVVRPFLRPAALTAVVVSNVVFIALVLAGGAGAPIDRVAVVDAVLLPLLGWALAVSLRDRAVAPRPQGAPR